MRIKKLKDTSLNKLAVGFSMLVSGLIQLSFISKSSIWHDEGYSLLLIRENFADIIWRTARDVHPPLYYLALKGWSLLFGTSELAVRSLSTLFIVLTVLIVFLLVKQLFGQGPARLAALFTAVGPFLIRYGQEARMFALVAFLLALATYLLITALDRSDRKRLYTYAVVVALAFYTHYYAVFIVPVHWLYVLLRTKWRASGSGIDIKSIHWWLSNAAIVALFAPWVPVVYGQFSRVQSGFWIPEVGTHTLPGTLGQFTLFHNMNNLPIEARLSIAAFVITVAVAAIALNAMQRAKLSLLVMYAFFTPIIVFIISLLAQPVYIDRYFAFAAVGFYALLATLLYVRPFSWAYKLRPLLIIGILVLFGFGIEHVYSQSNHAMREVGETVSTRYQTGDEIIAGELYVYLDFSYYNRTPETLKLYAPGGVSGYGETSLLYDKPELIVEDYTELEPSSGVVWVIGKPGEKDYFNNIPNTWEQTDEFSTHSSAARKYRVQ